MIQGSKRENIQQKINSKLKKISKKDLRSHLQAKMLQNARGRAKGKICARRISQLVDEEMVSCSVCLQIFLKPVLTSCGHCFCLQCSEDLAINGFPCGICHSQKPTLDLIVSKEMEKLVGIYLQQATSEEKQDYKRRNIAYQAKEYKRQIKAFYQGLMIDYWNEDSLCWKSGRIQGLNKYTVFVQDSKTKDVVEIKTQSRKLAHAFHYTTSFSSQKIDNPTFPFIAEVPSFTTTPRPFPSPTLSPNPFMFTNPNPYLQPSYPYSPFGMNYFSRIPSYPLPSYPSLPAYPSLSTYPIVPGYPGFAFPN